MGTGGPLTIGLEGFPAYIDEVISYLDAMRSTEADFRTSALVQTLQFRSRTPPNPKGFPEASFVAIQRERFRAMLPHALRAQSAFREGHFDQMRQSLLATRAEAVRTWE